MGWVRPAVHSVGEIGSYRKTFLQGLRGRVPRRALQKIFSTSELAPPDERYSVSRRKTESRVPNLLGRRPIGEYHFRIHPARQAARFRPALPLRVGV